MTATVTQPASGIAPPQRPVRSRRAGLIRLAGILGAVALVGFVVWLGLFSSVLGARTVTVSGTGQLNRDEVRVAAQVPLGRPMLRQDTDAIARRVAALPAVRSATVDRRWPHTIAIRIVERTPALAVRQPDGYLLADAAGVAYRTSSSVPAGVVVTDANPDDRLLLSELATVAAALPPKLSKQVISLRASDPTLIGLTLKSGLRISWGAADDSVLKAQIVTALLKQHPKSMIDVSSPHNPAIR